MKEKKKSVSKVSEVKVAEVEENVLKEVLVKEIKMKLFRVEVEGLKEYLYVVADTMENAIEKTKEILADYSETVTVVENGIVKESSKRLEEVIIADIYELATETKEGIFGEIKLY